MSRLRELPHLIFGVAALLLLPWIAILAVTQQDRGLAPNIEPLRLVLVGIIVVLGLVLVVHTAANRLTACMVGGVVSGFALCVVWFDLITRVGLPTTRLVVRLGGYSAMVGVCSALLALLWLYGPRSSGFAGPRALLFLAIALLALQATSILTNGALRLAVDNVGVAWVGLGRVRVPRPRDAGHHAPQGTPVRRLRRPGHGCPALLRRRHQRADVGRGDVDAVGARDGGHRDRPRLPRDRRGAAAGRPDPRGAAAAYRRLTASQRPALTAPPTSRPAG